MYRLIFMHMPKCAGRSVKALLNANYGSVLEVNNMNWLDKQKSEDLVGFPLIMGHIQFCNIRRLIDHYRFITILRDPLERTISQYNHFMTKKTSVKEAKIMRDGNYSFIDFVSANDFRLEPWVNSYVTYLGATGWTYNLLEFYQRAKLNIRKLDFIGIYEKLKESIEMMKEKYFLKGDLKTIGKTPENDKLVKLSASDEGLAKECLEPDYILYEMAKRGMSL